MVERECGDRLETEEHIFWDCKLYKDQEGNNDGHLVWQQKKKYPKSVTELLRLQEKDLCKACYSINKIYSNRNDCNHHIRIQLWALC
jgi:hypothetical protein